MGRRGGKVCSPILRKWTMLTFWDRKVVEVAVDEVAVVLVVKIMKK
jgi:hypothetical protein